MRARSQGCTPVGQPPLAGADIQTQQALRLRRDEVFYRSMWETAHDAILIAGPGSKIEYANPAVYTVFGRSPQPLLGTTVTTLLSGIPLSEQAHEFRWYLEGGQAQRDWDAVELTFQHGAGGAIPAEVSVDEMQVENGRTCLLFVSNIAARKQTEQARVDEREPVEAASPAKTQFLANMTHEIRTPHNGIIGMAEILKEEPLGATAGGYVEEIHRAGRPLLGVVNDALDFSKIEQGQSNVEREVFELPRVIQEVYDLYVESARAKHIELRWDLVRTLLPQVFGNPSRLRQILSNLVANAVKFTERGRIDLGVLPETADRIRFELRDTGIGIAPDNQKLIFEAFARIDGSATRRFGDAGLGLTITRQIRAYEQASPSRRRTPISALTAHAFDGYREACLAADMDDYMTKPVGTEDFTTLLERWIGDNTAPRQKTA